MCLCMFVCENMFLCVSMHVFVYVCVVVCVCVCVRAYVWVYFPRQLVGQCKILTKRSLLSLGL